MLYARQSARRVMVLLRYANVERRTQKRRMTMRLPLNYAGYFTEEWYNMPEKTCHDITIIVSGGI